MKKKVAKTVVAMLVSLTHLYGQQEQEIKLDAVTITTSLLEKRTSETGRNLTVIRGEDLKDLPVSSLDELLRYLPGLEIQARGPMGTQSDIVLRGGTFQQVLVVVDGLRINDPTTGHFSSYIPISPSEISRIEILKGASSSIYGSEAVGGVVSVITKTFDPSNNASHPTFVEGGITAGMHGLWNARAGGYWKNERWAVSGGIVSNNATGEELRGIKGYFHNHTASLSTRYQVSENMHVAYRASFDKRDFAAQNYYTVFVSDTATEKVTGWLQQLEIARKVRQSVFTVRGGYKHAVDDYLFNSSSIPNKNTSNLLQGAVTWQKNISDHTDWVVGVHYQQRQIRSNDRGNHAIQQLAPFVAASHRAGNLTIHPSLRLDWRQRIGSEWVPQLNLSYRLADWQLRGSVGKTIRDADFTERFNNYNKEVVAGGSVGNPALKAERSLSYEFGFDWFYGSNWKVSTSYFQRNQRDMIDYIPTPYDQMPRKENLLVDGAYALAQNIASVTTKGVEMDVQYHYKLSDDQRLHGMLGVTFLNSKQSNTVPSFYLASHARMLVNGSATYRVKRVRLSINGLYKEREPREASSLATNVGKSYLVLNAQTGFDLVPDRVTTYVQVDNLTNRLYSDLLGAIMPRRWVMAGVKLRI